MISSDTSSFAGVGVPSGAGPFQALVIGASFGGPRAIQAILTELPASFGLPVAVVQHTTPGMTGIWAKNLSAKCRIPVVEAVTRMRFEPGVVHIAPAGLQMRLVPGPRTVMMRLVPDRDESQHVPSVDILFASAAVLLGSAVLAVLLTGLGRDGAEGMLQVRRAGGYTIAESAATAMSFSMPGAACELGGVVEQLPLPAIAPRIVQLAALR